MNNLLAGSAFLCMWLGFLLLMIGCIASFFLWAVRNGQFSGQDRARHLPLTSGIPPAAARLAERLSENGEVS